ncbi:hypothetical protein ACFYV7_07355 [Nocardia suismassiliense]|uniref:Uncharacterized protein n=1 Tax=Nocardia suismassiliense TaxID=2077092 RepID=A0ABW6QN00_9NOCA
MPSVGGGGDMVARVRRLRRSKRTPRRIERVGRNYFPPANAIHTQLNAAWLTATHHRAVRRNSPPGSSPQLTTGQSPQLTTGQFGAAQRRVVRSSRGSEKTRVSFAVVTG